ncbi:MAG: chlorite dismutase family protein [Actinobacteria bacterium]|nr:chlorite dismutase family protein [Actinomycetota bacterium]
MLVAPPTRSIVGSETPSTVREASPAAIAALTLHASAPSASAAATNLFAVPERTFVKFTFFKLDPAWRRRSPSERAGDKTEFLAACEDFAEDRSLRAYSTVGTRGDTDLMILSQSPLLEDIHTFHVVLGQSGLARWSEIPYSYLAMTKPSPYSEESVRPEIAVSDRRYMFVYPFEKKREWYLLPLEERRRIMQTHIDVGRSYPEITINTTYSFGLDDQEFVVSFEGDEPGRFLDLVQELRGTESSAYTLRDTPIFTCVSMSLGRALDALDGTAATAVTPA